LGSVLQVDSHSSNQKISTSYGSRKSVTPFAAALEWPNYNPGHPISYFYNTVSYPPGFSLPHTATFNCIRSISGFAATILMHTNLYHVWYL